MVVRQAIRGVSLCKEALWCPYCLIELKITVEVGKVKTYLLGAKAQSKGVSQVGQMNTITILGQVEFKMIKVPPRW